VNAMRTLHVIIKNAWLKKKIAALLKRIMWIDERVR